MPRRYPKRSQLKYTKKPYRVRIGNNTKRKCADGRAGAAAFRGGYRGLAHAGWFETPRPTDRGLAIEAAVTIRFVYQLALRQTEDFYGQCRHRVIINVFPRLRYK